MTRHSKVFVPASVDTPRQLHIFNDDNDELIYVEEKENVYVLTEQEIEEYRTSLEVLKTMLRTANLQLGVEATEYLLEKLQSKTNPQTENKCG